MKKWTLSILFYIKKTKLLKTGAAPIYMRITVDGKRAETLKILLLFVAVVLSSFSRDSQRTEAGVTKTVRFDGVIITNPASGYTVCIPPAVPNQIPLIAHSRTGTREETTINLTSAFCWSNFV